MEDVLAVYEKPLSAQEPVVCVDEKPVALHQEVWPGLAIQPGRVARRDSEYRRCGTANVFCGVEPKAGLHLTKVTPNRSSPEFADYLLEVAVKYPEADTIHSGDGQSEFAHAQSCGRAFRPIRRRLAVESVHGALHPQARPLVKPGRDPDQPVFSTNAWASAGSEIELLCGSKPGLGTDGSIATEFRFSGTLLANRLDANLATQSRGHGTRFTYVLVQPSRFIPSCRLKICASVSWSHSTCPKRRTGRTRNSRTFFNVLSFSRIVAVCRYWAATVFERDPPMANSPSSSDRNAIPPNPSEDDQLLRQGCERQGPRGRQSWTIRWELDAWMETLPQPWAVAMEATVFTGWIYDHLRPHAEQVKVAHPLMLRAIAGAKNKNDQVDASKIADCLRCDFLPECYMASSEIRDRRRTLRYRHLLVLQMVQMKN